jgi:VanZ family protein
VTRRLWQWGPAVLHMALIYAASATSDPALPDGVSDKSAHFGAYAVLGALMARALAGGAWDGYTWPKAAVAWALAAAYGATDEWHQAFVPGRVLELGDWMADVAGAAAGAFSLTAGVRARARRGRTV